MHPPAAEAINFALEEWVEAGKAAVPCTCSALPEGVQLDMAIFCPELREDGSGDDAEEEEEEGSSEEEEKGEEGQPATSGRRAAKAAAKRPTVGSRATGVARATDVVQAHAGAGGKRRASAPAGEGRAGEGKRQRTTARPPPAPQLPGIAKNLRVSNAHCTPRLSEG